MNWQKGIPATDGHYWWYRHLVVQLVEMETVADDAIYLNFIGDHEYLRANENDWFMGPIEKPSPPIEIK